MRWIPLTRFALRSIRRNPGRSALTILGMVIGVGSVVVMVAIGQGAQARIQAQVDALGTHLVVVTPGASTRGGVSGGAGSLNRLTLEDAERLEREGLRLSAVSPVIFTRTRAVGGGGNWRTMIHGVNSRYLEIRDWQVASGRPFDRDDERARRKVALLGHTVAEALFPEQDPVGQQVTLRGVPMKVLGVLQRKGQTADGTDQDDVVLVPHTTVQARLSGWSFIAQILASAWSKEDVPEAMAEVRTLMRHSHRLASWEEDDFTVRDQGALGEAARGTTEVMTTLLAAIASISLLVGGIGIMNIMLVSVTERTREIGIRRAVGARGSDVLAQFLVESCVLSALGGVAGLVLGVVATVLVGRLTGWATAISPSVLLLSFGFSAAVGIFFGWYPARRAAALDPIEALRHS
ncbi:ABC transporter permease [Myxococcota bacterium]|nr:ABC transporter permease [Myxococcota bacterium]